jgi:hypothetical protein
VKKIFFLLAAFSSSLALATPPGDLNLTPTSLKLKVYKMAVSTSGLCTDLITVVDNGNTPSEIDFTSDPTIGSGSIADGTYPCIVIEFADAVKFMPPNSASGACLSSVEETLDVCRSPGTSALISGATTSCGTPGTSDRVAMYISTYAGATSNSDAFNPPTSNGDTAHGLTLGAALTISGTAAGKFVVNPAGQVCDDTNDNTSSCEGGGSSNTCNMGPPAFSFSSL